MKSIISFLIQIFILCAIGYAVFHFLGANIAYAILFGIGILWLLGQKNYTDSKLREIDSYLITIMTYTKPKG